MSGELQSRKVEVTDNQEGIQLTEKSTSRRQACTSHDDVRLEIEDEELIAKLIRQKIEIMQEEKEKLKVLPNEGNRTKIQRVPKSMLQNLDNKYFVPKELSIGFFHAAFPHRELKLQLAAHFILESGSTEEVIFKGFKSEMKDIKTCFDENIIKGYLSDKQLIRLLFLDGCAMLGFIHCYVNQKLKVVGVSDAKAAEIERDLLLLENQIPFQVLEVLIGSGTDIGKKNLKESFLRFIFLISTTTFHRDSPQHLYTYLEGCFSPKKKKNQKPAHLLDLFREVLLLDASSFCYFEKTITPIRVIFLILYSLGCIAICCVMQCFRNKSYDTIPWRMTKQFFHSVQVLKAARIKFKPTHSLKSISFHFRFFATPKLMLPTLVVDDSTEHKLFNPVAYELCLSKSHPSQKPWVTSYVNLLDLLIENEQDFKDLKAADILRNNLNNNKDVAYKMIKSIGSRSFAPSKDTYAGVKKNIQKHCKSKCATWMAEICEAHFRSRWSVMALFAATTVLVLTAVQTWYAINPKK